MIEPSLSGYEPEDVQRIASERLNLKPKQTNSQLNDPNRQGIWLRDVDPKLDEFRKNARLYTHGGSIHYGVPPEER